MLNLPDLEQRLDKALENETKESLTNWIKSKRNMKNQMVFFAETRPKAIQNGNEWIRSFVGFETIKSSEASCYFIRNDKACYVFTWEPKESANG